MKHYVTESAGSLFYNVNLNSLTSPWSTGVPLTHYFLFHVREMQKSICLGLV